MNWYIEVLKKYAVFSGRAHTGYQLAVPIPSIAVGFRRMHDIDHSGWWLLVPIVNLVFAVSEGTQGYNRFGPDPKAISQTV